MRNGNAILIIYIANKHYYRNPGGAIIGDFCFRNSPLLNLYYNNGNIGIGTNIPNYKLDLGSSFGNTGSVAAKKLALFSSNDIFIGFA